MLFTRFPSKTSLKSRLETQRCRHHEEICLPSKSCSRAPLQLNTSKKMFWHLVARAEEDESWVKSNNKWFNIHDLFSVDMKNLITIIFMKSKHFMPCIAEGWWKRRKGNKVFQLSTLHLYKFLIFLLLCTHDVVRARLMPSQRVRTWIYVEKSLSKHSVKINQMKERGYVEREDSITNASLIIMLCVFVWEIQCHQEQDLYPQFTFFAVWWKKKKLHHRRWRSAAFFPCQIHEFYADTLESAHNSQRAQGGWAEKTSCETWNVAFLRTMINLSCELSCARVLTETAKLCSPRTCNNSQLGSSSSWVEVVQLIYNQDY